MSKQKRPFIISSVTLPKKPGDKSITVHVKSHEQLRSPKLFINIRAKNDRAVRRIKIALRRHVTKPYKWVGTYDLHPNDHQYVNYDQDQTPQEITQQKYIDFFLTLQYKVGGLTILLPRSKRYKFKLPRPLRIALMGDSYAAGLGTGVYDLSDPEEEPAAFRSSLSGGELLMRDLQERYRISYIDVTYAGAQLMGGNETSRNAKRKLKSSLLFDHGNDEGVGAGEQFKQVLAWAGKKKVDYIIMTIGGNDMYEDDKGYSGLDRLVYDAVKKNITKKRKKEEFISKVTTGLNTLEEGFVKLKIFLERHESFINSKLILSSYPDLTKDENGDYKEAYSQWFTIKKDEMEILYDELFEPLNQKIEDACTLNQWKFNNVMVNNPEIVRHGLPSNDSWFHQLDRAGKGSDKKNEPGNRVSLHPTRTGHNQIYYTTLKKVFTKIHTPIRYIEPETLDLNFPKKKNF